MTIDADDRRIINATQSGLPLTPAPYAEVARWLGISEGEVIARLTAMQESGVIRRIALAPNHYALGVTANGMSVWDVADEAAETLGALVRHDTAVQERLRAAQQRVRSRKFP